jgi:HAMP domain-containing protein
MDARAQAVPQRSNSRSTTYRVFLSSTSRDLAEYREAVHRAIDGLPGFQLVKMEDFGARDTSAKDLCARVVRDCDLFVGLTGHYYGSCPPNEPVSFAELEYRTATAANLSRLMFVATDDFAIPASLRESDASFERQQAFRREVMTELVVGALDSPEKVASAVTRALFVWHEEKRRVVQTEVAAPAPAEPGAETPLGPNPYRGLEAFRKEDADRFFGREPLVDQLWNAFLRLHAARGNGETPVRLLTILGASGSGKSSVAQAGLLAELEQRPLPGRPSPITVIFTPGARPLESLAVAFARQATSEPSPAQKAIEFEGVLRRRDRHDGLRYLAERMLHAGKTGLIILVDQFEELYSLCDEEQERAEFISNLLQAASEPRGHVSIVLTLRGDFLGSVNQNPELSRLIAGQNVVVPVMSEAELRRAIEQPARRAGCAIDHGTVQVLLDQTRGREGALPLLEFVLTRIWDGITKGIAAAQTLDELGGVGGALAGQAQAVYESLGPNDREVARRAFLAMVRLGDGTRVTRRRASLSEMVAKGESPDSVLRVLRRFTDPECRLITLAAADGATTAEVAHEALFDQWQLLHDWVDAKRLDLRFGRELTRSAKTRLLLQTSTFRMGLLYLASFGLSALALLGFLYYATAGFMARQTEETIQAEIVGLAEQYRAQGLDRLREVIAQRSAAHRSSIYLLVDAHSRRVAGNLDRWPAVAPGPQGWVTFAIEVGPDARTVERRRARAASFLLNDGFRLLVGREVEDRLQIEAQIRRALGWGLALILLLGLASSVVISLVRLGRVDAIDRTSRRIMAGDLSQRIALKASGDEIDRLAELLNDMLDQIEKQHVRSHEIKQTRGK